MNSLLCSGQTRYPAPPLALTASDVARPAAGGTTRGASVRISRLILAAQPVMAPLVSLIGEVVTAIEGIESLEGDRLAATRAADDFRPAYGISTSRSCRSNTSLPSSQTAAWCRSRNSTTQGRPWWLPARLRASAQAKERGHRGGPPSKQVLHRIRLPSEPLDARAKKVRCR
jgi:hypothetical protein